MVQSYCHNIQTYEPACFFLTGWRLQLSAFTRGRYWVFHIIRICSFKITCFPAHFVLCKDTFSVQTLYHLWSKDSSGEYSVNVGSQTSFYHDEVKRTTRWLRSLKWQATCFMKSEVAQSCGLFAIPWTVAYQAPPSIEFSRQEYWDGLPLPSAGDLPDRGIKPMSPTLQADALPSEPPGKPTGFIDNSHI